MSYLFEKKGEGLPMHAHTGDGANLVHDVLCISGRALVYGPYVKRRVLLPGDLYEFDSNQLHEVVGLEPMTLVLNTFTLGMPEGYDLLPTAELAGIAVLGPCLHKTDEAET